VVDDEDDDGDGKRPNAERLAASTLEPRPPRTSSSSGLRAMPDTVVVEALVKVASFKEALVPVRFPLLSDARPRTSVVRPRPLGTSRAATSAAAIGLLEVCIGALGGLGS